MNKKVLLATFFTAASMTLIAHTFISPNQAPQVSNVTAQPVQKEVEQAKPVAPVTEQVVTEPVQPTITEQVKEEAPQPKLRTIDDLTLADIISETNTEGCRNYNSHDGGSNLFAAHSSRMEVIVKQAIQERTFSLFVNELGQYACVYSGTKAELKLI